MERLLIGQDSVYDTFEQIIKDPPHIFLTGPFGYGKTSLATAFLETYFKQFGISPTDLLKTQVVNALFIIKVA